MRAQEAAGFWCSDRTSAIDDDLLVDYLIECEGDPELAAARFCSEQSTAQWRRPGTAKDLRPRFGAKILELWVLHSKPAFSYGLGVHSRGTGLCLSLVPGAPVRQLRPQVALDALGVAG